MLETKKRPNFHSFLYYGEKLGEDGETMYIYLCLDCEVVRYSSMKMDYFEDTTSVCLQPGNMKATREKYGNK